jgi:hypothetical protein
MPLSISDILSGTGANGVAGLSGASGSSPGGHGGPGTPGGPGAALLLGLGNRTLLGDAGGDQVTISRSATGGSGGATGFGGRGASGVVVSNITETTQSARTQTITFGTAGDGGAGGAGGDGGLADARIWNLSVDLAGGAASQNGLTLQLTARGGDGAPGNSGGAGGDTNAQVLWITDNATAPDDIYIVGAPPGGQGGAGGAGGDGGDARAVHSGVTVRGENVLLDISATATGGAAREGALGGTGGGGGGALGGGFGGRGGDGGDGGAARARLFGLDVEVTGGLNLTIALSAKGGKGGAGGQGGTAGFGSTSDRLVQGGITNQTNTTTHADPGAGGQGGDGGGASARLVESRILGSGANDTVSITLTAEGGGAGLGGRGGPAVASSETVFDSGGSIFRTVINGTPAGATGADGVAGSALVLLRGTSILLGGGTDTLTFSLLASGPGDNRVTVLGNVFDGGPGMDEIRFGTGRAGEAAVFVDVGAETVRFGRPGAPANALTGFEQFRGTSGNDRFRDGAGDHVYRGGGGDDLFVFFARNQGHDRVLDFAAGDVVGLRGFGAALDSFAELLGVAQDSGGGVLITTGAASSIWLGGLSVASLNADMFSF